MRHIPSHDRPRERLIQSGAEALADAELLAILLGHGFGQYSALELARQLLNHFGSLRRLFYSDYPSFCREPGLGPARYCLLQAANELARRCHHEALIREGGVQHAADASDYILSKLGGYTHEVFACLWLDNRHQIIHFSQLFHGGTRSAEVHCGEVVKDGLKHNASAVILTHNHPSGVLKPSDADCQITVRLISALGLVDINVLDHLIVGHNQTCSMASLGLM